jgi:hypothetical protein
LEVRLDEEELLTVLLRDIRERDHGTIKPQFLVAPVPSASSPTSPSPLKCRGLPAVALAKAGLLLFPPYPATLEAPLKVGLQAMPALEVLVSVTPRDRTTQEERESVPAVLPRATDQAFSLMRRPARRGRLGAGVDHGSQTVRR